MRPARVSRGGWLHLGGGTFEEVRDRVVEAAESIAPDCLGTTDDCGFAPFADDSSSTSRDIAFEKIRARVVGTQLAAAELRI